jgi:hypothetical protein
MIAQLAQRAGYAIQIHPHPNQQQIIVVLQQIITQSGFTIRKGPSLHVDRAVVSVSLEPGPDESQLAHLQAQVQEQIGYRLEVT